MGIYRELQALGYQGSYENVRVQLTAEEQTMLTRIRQIHPELDLAYALAQQFVQMMRTRTGEQLDACLEAVASSSLTDLQSFVGSVSEDKEAVLAGLTRDESNGPTEGHIDCPQTDQTQHVWSSQV